MEKFTITDCLYKANGREVLLVTDKATGKCLVIKKLRVNEMKDDEQAETIKEVQALLRLQHRHIISIISSFKEEATRTINIVLPYYSGGDLFGWIEKHRKAQTYFPTADIIMILHQLCEALAYIHSQHILHRDIKPRNIFVENDWTVKLGDFGIAKILESTIQDAETHNIGTFPYTAPEIFSKGSYRQKCDMWSLGCVLYEIITLERPFQANVWHELIYQITNDPYPPLPRHVDRNLANLVAELLHKDPRKRPDAEQVLKRKLEFVMVMKTDVFVNEFSCNMESTRSIAVDYIKYLLDKCGYTWNNDGRQANVTPNSVQAAMRSLGDEFEERFGSHFAKLAPQLHVTQDTASETFSAIVAEVFIDEVTWGRVVALFGFSGHFGVLCFERNMPNMVDHVVEWVTAYIDNNLSEWMESHGKWEGFLEFYNGGAVSRKNNPWPTFKTICGYAAAGLGAFTLGAFLAQKS